MPVGAARSGVRALLGGRSLIVETVMVSEVTARTATLWGELVSLGPFEWADVSFDLAPIDQELTQGDQYGGEARFDHPATFTIDVEGLEPETEYHFRARAFALDVTLEAITNPPTEVTETSATLNGDLEEYDFQSETVTGDNLEFTTNPLLDVETLPVSEIQETSVQLNGDLAHYYPDEFE